MGKQKPGFMKPVQPGGLLQLMTVETMPPAQAPLPLLKDSDVEEPPLPAAVSVSSPRPSEGGKASPTTSFSPRVQPHKAAACIITYLAMLLLGPLCS